jgi:endonuclease YncB( thermonuclease family)
MIAAIVFGLALLAVPVWADDFLDVKYQSCHDADTCKFDLGENLPRIFRFMPVRFVNIDTPEIRGHHCGEEFVKALDATTYVRKRLGQAKRIDVLASGLDNFSRVLAVVLVDGVNINQELIARGYARPYHGGKRKGWCE